jgi:uncharacterized membrane protein
MQGPLWASVSGLILLAVVAGVADWRRGRRKRESMDEVGFMPWALVQILSLTGALMLAVIAFH